MITSVEEFVRLRCSEKIEEYERAAKEEAPMEIWESIIKEHKDMRQWVAYNKTVPLSILEILSYDTDPKVRWFVAQKRKLNRKIFEKLASDSDETVRQRIAYNKKTPLDILEKLKNDESFIVSEAAKERFVARQ